MSKRRADDRQALGREIKRLRADMAASQVILNTAPLLSSWDKCTTKWEAELEKTKADCQRLRQLVSLLSTETVVHLQEACVTITEFSSQLLERMDKLLGLYNDGVLEETANAIARCLSGCGGYRPNASERVMAKFRFYAADGGFEGTMAQVKLLHSVPRPAIIEDSDDELQEQLWTNAFRETNYAVEIAGNTSGKQPLTISDTACVGSVFLDKCQELGEQIQAFAGDGPDTRRYVALVHTKILAKEFHAIMPKLFCSSCLEEKQDAAACGNCNIAICQDCFSRKMMAQSAKGWPEAGAIARLECDGCKTGAYDEALIRHLSPSSSRLYLHATRADEFTAASATASLERTRDFEQILAQPDTDAILYCTLKAALADLVTIRTPCNCRRAFAEMEGCCAIECDDCGTFFCGLCLAGSWDRDEAHRHVENCRCRPPTMTDAHFLPLQEWKRHMALRQHRIVQDWISARPDMPETVRRRLLDEDFPLPEAPAV